MKKKNAISTGPFSKAMSNYQRAPIIIRSGSLIKNHDHHYQLPLPIVIRESGNGSAGSSLALLLAHLGRPVVLGNYPILAPKRWLFSESGNHHWIFHDGLCQCYVNVTLILSWFMSFIFRQFHPMCMLISCSDIGLWILLHVYQVVFLKTGLPLCRKNDLQDHQALRLAFGGHSLQFALLCLRPRLLVNICQPKTPENFRFVTSI